ncbi:MAG TPA: hypothetical protein VEA40_10725 [Ramlibacter sp.]|nr:hypothetical protein [Ramlibacter sp.]
MTSAHVPTLTVLVLLLAGCAASAPAPGPHDAMAGRWRDEACQARPTQYPIKNIFVRRDFSFERPGAAGGSPWGVDARFYSDAQCTQPVFTLHVRGRYEITGPSSGVPGAADGTFRFDRRAVTPYSREAVEAFTAARCGGAPAQAGREIDVSTSGCAPALSRPIAQSGQEYDLVGLEGGRLRFGVRTPEMGVPEGRPKQLSPFWLARLP